MRKLAKEIPLTHSNSHQTGNRLYLWVLLGVIIGIGIGYVNPTLGRQLKPLGDGFIALVRMMISPIIFFTVVLGICGMADLKRLSRVGAKAIIYFELISTLALFIGLISVNVLKPGASFGVDPSKLNPAEVSEYITQSKELNFIEFLMHLIPKTFADAFTADGNLLQVLLIAVMFGLALSQIGKHARFLKSMLEILNKALFIMIHNIMKLAPLGALGAMASTVGAFGAQALKPLLLLMATFYFSCIFFIVLVLGAVAKYCGFSIFNFILYIKDELLTVLGTSSSETALAPLMEKLENLGCPKSIVGIVVPAGYSFNLDGTNIYMTSASLFIAQALGIELSLSQQLAIVGVAMLTSKGASGVTGSGFITLAATLSVVPAIPVAGITLIFGIDRFMSEARALTNIIGNGIATLFISQWEQELDKEKLSLQLNPK